MISLTKIIGAVFSLLMAYSTFLNYKKKNFNKLQFIFWEIVWISMLAVVFFTNIATEAVRAVGFMRLMDFLTVAGFIIIIILSFSNYSDLKKVNMKIEKIVREEAFKKLNK